MMLSQADIDLAAVLSLPPVDQLDAVLHTARLPVDPRSRTILMNAFLQITHECALWEAERQRPDLGKDFGEISEAVSSLLKFLSANNGRCQVVSIMESGTVWRAPLQQPPFQTLAELRDAALFYNRLYGHRAETRNRPTEYDDFIYERLYRLFEEIKESRPGNTYLLYNFTMKCVDLLRIKVNSVTPDAFRMRVKRRLDKQRRAFGGLAAIASDLPPPAFDRLPDEELTTFGNMAVIVQNMS